MIGELLELGRLNLESRIKGLETDIEARQQISDQALSALLTHKAQLKDQERQALYRRGFGENQDFTKQISRLEESVISEMTSCFGDISRLREKLRDAQEQLAVEEQKLRLATSKNHQAQPQELTPTPTTSYEPAPRHLFPFAPKYSVFN